MPSAETRVDDFSGNPILLPRIWPTVFTVGVILFVVAASEGLMALIALAAKDGLAGAFAASSAFTAFVAAGCWLTTRGRPFELRFRDAALLTTALWFVVPLFAALPLMAEPVGLRFVDAYFEMVSGITTTGSTVMTGLDGMPASILLWRSTIQWLGGIGIIGLAIAILPFLKIGGMQLFRLESSDRSEKLLPNARRIASAVGQVYVALTLACFMTYWLLGMTPFDALNHAFTTLPTAGFSTHDASFGYFENPAIQWAGVVFMTCGAIPFLAYIRMARPGTMAERIDRQAITLVTFLSVVIFGFAGWMIVAKGFGVGEALTRAAFNVTSIVTTTGFASFDYTALGAFAAVLFFFLSFVGGCTGSTGGAMKIFRFQVMGSVIVRGVRRSIYPHAILPARYGNQVLSNEQISSVAVFVVLYLITFAAVAIILAVIGLDAEVAISSAAQAVGNIGPGIGPIVGPAGNFAGLPDTAKLILAVAMILGRLEILGVLVLFLPNFYR